MPFGAPEIALMILALVLLFGASRLPRIVRSRGTAKRKLKQEVVEESLLEKVDTPLVISTIPSRSVTSSVTDEKLLSEMQRRAGSGS